MLVDAYPHADLGEALIRGAVNLACQFWNERMWYVGELIDPSPTVDHPRSKFEDMVAIRNLSPLIVYKAVIVCF